MTIVGKDDFHINIDAIKVKNPDVTGAGDTVIAVLSLILVFVKILSYLQRFLIMQHQQLLVKPAL